ncbi:hypothetical protein [Vacuolonema iberomarrocanum]|uniref:hypothetical protein n=1 Tax=Vacuolonema iberomarrocanum TaxID=3454632 RepID=UPI0019FB711D|nr:hypothetical protein [filamentous cyanobacterium LEGE 07170]
MQSLPGCLLVMHYSMRARFQGALLGAVVGSRWRSLNLLQPSPEREVGTEAREAPDSAEWALKTAAALAQHLTLNGTRQIPWHLWQPTSAELEARSTQIALLTLPLALYCHDNLPRFHHCLQAAMQAWELPSAESHPAKSLGQLLAIAFGDPIGAAQLTQSVCQTLHPDQASTFPEAHWHWLNTALKQRQSLAIADSTLPTIADASPPLAMALLIFLTSPTDAVWALARPSGLPHPTLTAALVGAIVGSYNGIAAFPSIVRGWGDRLIPATDAQQLERCQSWLQLADALLASWAGLYIPQQFPLPDSSLQAIAPPKPT